MCLSPTDVKGNFKHIFCQACSCSGAWPLEPLVSAHASRAGALHSTQREGSFCSWPAVLGCNQVTLPGGKGTPFFAREKGWGEEWYSDIIRTYPDRSPSGFLSACPSVLVSVLSACICHGLVDQMWIPVTVVSIVLNLRPLKQLSSPTSSGVSRKEKCISGVTAVLFSLMAKLLIICKVFLLLELCCLQRLTRVTLSPEAQNKTLAVLSLLYQSKSFIFSTGFKNIHQVAFRLEKFSH